MFYTWIHDKEDYSITTNPAKIDFNVLHHFLANESYWNPKIPRRLVETAVINSIPFSLLSPSEQFIGFARVVTDRALFAWLADVFILKAYRGRGLGKWLVQTMMNHVEFQGFCVWLLATKDAHNLYSQFGWKNLDKPETIMGIIRSAKEVFSD